ncbi:hypothetical protein [Lysobacter sp. Root604]|uniref:hypothetical protein n=1 Tax=Lysobacter sp. Root604 TaxID=1736568 RepID=UPI0006FF6BDA|nr:hypothetical protein [Lysobacter sp. Root604]KRA20805.1 hypothetical protein ASD69_05735 [Lysobacter sp. Root604]
MMVRKLLAIFLSLFSAGAYSHEYQTGQIWQYKTRPGEEQSRLYIAKVETLSNGELAFHIYLDNLRISNERLPGQVQTELPHAPVSTKTLDLSVIKLQGSTANPPDVSEGYAAWREAYDAGEGGVFTIPVSQIVDFIEEVARQHLGTPPNNSFKPKPLRGSA